VRNTVSVYKHVATVVKSVLKNAVSQYITDISNKRKKTIPETVFISGDPLKISMTTFLTLCFFFNSNTEKKLFPYYGDKHALCKMLAADLLSFFKLENIPLEKQQHTNNFYKLCYQDKMSLGLMLYDILIDKFIIQEKSEYAIRTESDLKVPSYQIYDLKQKYYCRYVYCTPLEKTCFKLTYPMISIPNTWVYENDITNDNFSSEIHYGGYVTKKGKHKTLDFHSIFTSKSPTNYYIQTSKQTFSICNKLNCTAFKINSTVLKHYLNNYDYFVKIGFLMDKKYIHLDALEYVKSIRDSLTKKNCTDNIEFKEFEGLRFDEILKEIRKRCVLANRENNIFQICDIYQRYTVYFPIFFDYRGRHYRYGLFNPQSDSLSKSLLCFKEHVFVDESLMDTYYTYCAFFFYKFNTNLQALNWFKENYEFIKNNVNNFHENFDIDKLEDKFQAYLVVLQLHFKQKEKNTTFYTSMILSVDADASAFQMYSLLAFDRVVAATCRIIPKEYSDKIYSLYSGNTLPDLYDLCRKILIKELTQKNEFGVNSRSDFIFNK